MKADYSYLKRSLYISYANTAVAGFAACGALERLAEGHYISAAVFGATSIANVVSGIMNYRITQKPFNKKSLEKAVSFEPAPN